MNADTRWLLADQRRSVEKQSDMERMREENMTDHPRCCRVTCINIWHGLERSLEVRSKWPVNMRSQNSSGTECWTRGVSVKDQASVEVETAVLKEAVRVQCTSILETSTVRTYRPLLMSGCPNNDTRLQPFNALFVFKVLQHETFNIERSRDDGMLYFNIELLTSLRNKWDI